VSASFRHNRGPRVWEIGREEEAVFCGADRRGAPALKQADPPGGHLGADAALLEETVAGIADRPVAAAQAAAGRAAGMVFWGRAESAQFIRRHAEYTSKRNDDPRRRKLHFCFLIGNHALRGAHLTDIIANRFSQILMYYINNCMQ
jgi:hypothetical protein